MANLAPEHILALLRTFLFNDLVALVASYELALLFRRIRAFLLGDIPANLLFNLLCDRAADLAWHVPAFLHRHKLALGSGNGVADLRGDLLVDGAANSVGDILALLPWHQMALLLDHLVAVGARDLYGDLPALSPHDVPALLPLDLPGHLDRDLLGDGLANLLGHVAALALGLLVRHRADHGPALLANVGLAHLLGDLSGNILAVNLWT